MRPGDVVIVLDTNQAGTIEWVTSTDVCVLLRSKEVWVGLISSIRTEATPEELAATVIEVERRVTKIKRGGKRHE